MTGSWINCTAKCNFLFFSIISDTSPLIVSESLPKPSRPKVYPSRAGQSPDAKYLMPCPSCSPISNPHSVSTSRNLRSVYFGSRRAIISKFSYVLIHFFKPAPHSLGLSKSWFSNAGVISITRGMRAAAAASSPTFLPLDSQRGTNCLLRSSTDHHGLQVRPAVCRWLRQHARAHGPDGRAAAAVPCQHL